MSLAKVFLSAAVLLASSPAMAKDGHRLFEIDSFRGNERLVVIRGVTGGGQPWVFDSIDAKLDAPREGETHARLRVKVKGLVFAPNTPLAGTRGEISHYAATLSCFTGSDTSAANHVLVSTTGFEVNDDGDADIDDAIDVPAVCFGAVLFVRAWNPGTGQPGGWFAVSGF